MRKYLNIIVVGLAALSIVGCGSKADDNSQNIVTGDQAKKDAAKMHGPVSGGGGATKATVSPD